MQIMTEVGRPLMIDSLTAPLAVSHYWTLSGQMMDFKLEAMDYLEETTGPTISVRIHGMEMDLPVSWNVVAVDRETSTIDSIPLTACATFQHEIMLFSPSDCKLVTANMQILDYHPKRACIHPMIPKGAMMIHPTSMQDKLGKPVLYGIICGPADLHRFIGGKTIGDILG